MNILGWTIKREKDELPLDEDKLISFAEPLRDDGAITITSGLAGSYSLAVDLEGQAKTESELITKYRSMMLQAEIQVAVEEIVNEGISVDSHEKVVDIVLDDVDVADKIKDRIREEFENILDILDFSNKGYEMFQKWYVDGRLNYHVIIDPEKTSDGILELRYIDPRKIRMVREIDPTIRDPRTGVELKAVKNEYYVYSENGFGGANTNSMPMSSQKMQGFKIAKDAIVRVTSGLMDETNTQVLSYLHKAIKPLNQLRILEDSTVIYTLTRAPERRIFYIDTGDLTKQKADQHVQQMMTRYKNKLQYNAGTGEITDSRRFMTLTEDFWFSRRGGERSTEIDTLPAGQGLGTNENIDYFSKKLYKSLGVPIGRLESENAFSIGRATEITREEIKFSKFIRRLRAQFSGIFDQILEKQLVVRGVISPDDWDLIKNKVRYDFMKDNYFEELKEVEILKDRVAVADIIEPYVGKYFSRAWVRQNVLFLSDDEVKDINKEMDKERKSGEIAPSETEEPPMQEPVEQPTLES